MGATLIRIAALVNRHVFVMRSDGTDVRRLTDDAFEEGTPAFAPKQELASVVELYCRLEDVYRTLPRRKVSSE